MGIKYEEITKEIISLYCENKPAKAVDCVNEECQSGRCLCIDEEQIRLVSFFAGFSYDIGLKDSQMIINSQESMDGDVFCVNQREFNRRLVSCKGRNPDALEKLIAGNRVYLSNQNLFKIIRTLPLIQSINALYPVEERGTISYLCLYGNEAGGFLKGLLSEMVCQMTDEFIASQSSANLLCAAEKIFGKISEIYNQKETYKFEHVLRGNIRDYIESYDQEEQSLALVASDLRKYNNELECRNEKTKIKDACSFILSNSPMEKVDIPHIYRIFRQLTIAAGQKPSQILDNFFEKAIRDMEPHTIYDELEGILGNWKKYKGEKAYEILKALKGMLLKEDGMCDEELNDLKEILSGI